MLNKQLKSQGESEEKIAQLRKKNKESEDKIQAMHKENSELKREVSLLKSETELLNSHITSHEQTIDDLNKKIESQQLEIGEIQEQREEISNNFNDLTSKLVELENELYQSKQERLELVQQCQQLDNELEGAKYRVYVPKREDMIDEALGDFLNNYPEREKLKILFLRETEGVYQFGTRRIHIKVEKGNQILVRVGGGYLLIEDFIKQYTGNQVEKRERNDVNSRFKRKLSVQKISRQLSTTARETSPIAVPQRPSVHGTPKYNLKRRAFNQFVTPNARSRVKHTFSSTVRNKDDETM